MKENIDFDAHANKHVHIDSVIIVYFQLIIHFQGFSFSNERASNITIFFLINCAYGKYVFLGNFDFISYFDKLY